MTMTPFQREGLQLLGYGRRESEFLFVVATHSGYFTAHQFKSFAQTNSASVSQAFIRKLLEQRHASYRAYRSGERVYHLFARKVYQAIDRENLRTRKKHELEYVKTRLVALDFILAHPGHRYLETEAEKIDFFAKEHQVERTLLPVKLYRARKSAEVTPRYFVDRFPLFLDRASGALTFTYIDAGAVTLDGFRTHLRAYAGLFQALPAFHFVYAAPTQRLFPDAESEFQRIVAGSPASAKRVSVLDYFRLRRAWDNHERVASADVVLLKEAQRHHAGKRLDSLYEQWRNGSANDDEVMRVAQRFDQSRQTFAPILCGSSLKVFTDPLVSNTQIAKDGTETSAMEQSSTERSIQASGP